MKKLALVLLAAVSLTFVTQESKAASTTSGTDGGLMINAAFMRIATETSGPTLGNTTSNMTIFDLKAGYTLAAGLYFGGMYDIRMDETNGAKQERNALGATVGYHNDGWFIDGTYFFTSTIKMPSGAEVKNGTGFGISLGHNFDLGSNIYIGFQVSHKQFSYANVNSASEVNKLSELIPMLAIGVAF